MNFMFVLLIIFSAVLEIPELLRQRQTRDLVVFLFVAAFALIATILYAVGVNLPSPITGAKHLIDDILKISYH